MVWPGFEPKKTKIAWIEVCKPKSEGGLGIQYLKEANKISCLKLIWRIVSGQNSIWLKWISATLLKGESFWALKENAGKGSWMWRKLLKYRDIAKWFHKVEIQNGKMTSFLFDNWFQASVAWVKNTHRRRRHRSEAFNQFYSEPRRHLIQCWPSSLVCFPQPLAYFITQHTL